MENESIHDSSTCYICKARRLSARKAECDALNTRQDHNEPPKIKNYLILYTESGSTGRSYSTLSAVNEGAALARFRLIRSEYNPVEIYELVATIERNVEYKLAKV